MKSTSRRSGIFWNATKANKDYWMICYLPPCVLWAEHDLYGFAAPSEFPQRFDVTFLDITVAKRRPHPRSRTHPRRQTVQDDGGLSRLRECWLLSTHRPRSSPARWYRSTATRSSGDAVLLGLARAFGVPTVTFTPMATTFPIFHGRSKLGMQRLIARTLPGRRPPRLCWANLYGLTLTAGCRRRRFLSCRPG